VDVYLIDGTYELFRSYFALPKLTAPGGRPVGAVHGLVQSLLLLLREERVTHVACAFDRVIESFRNDMFPGYKTGRDTPPDLLEQFELAERAVAALGVTSWPMEEFEADDAIASAVARLRDDPGVGRIVICSPDKDLAQLVEGRRIVCLDRRRNETIDEEGVAAKFGVPPASIPDLLALTGDAADGIPGLPGWGPKSSAALLARYRRVEDIPADSGEWDVAVRGAARLGAVLAQNAGEVRLYKQLATLRTDAPIDASTNALEWPGAVRETYTQLCEELGLTRLKDLPHRWTA
jgi:5'-3' exonuclease